MSGNKLPIFKSTDELVEFFDTHDMGEYADDLPEEDFDIRISKRSCLVEIDKTLMKKIAEMAKLRHISTAKLVNNWLEEMTYKAA